MPGQPDAAALIEQGRAALLQGDRATARALLEQAIAQAPDSDEAWLWLAGTHTDPALMAACLRRALAINPHNEQAQEGLHWLAEQHGSAFDAPAPPAGAATAAPPAPLSTASAMPDVDRSWPALLEAALHPLAAGALLGLTRLTAWLWPAELLRLRQDQALGLAGALGITLLTALAHGGALLLAWLALGRLIDRIRVTGRGDRFDSLLRVGRAWTPAYLWSGALVALLLGLRLGPAGWRTLTLLAGVLLLIGAALVGRRLWRLPTALGLAEERQPSAALQLLIGALLVALPGLLLAGWLSRALWRII